MCEHFSAWAEQPADHMLTNAFNFRYKIQSVIIELVLRSFSSFKHHHFRCKIQSVIIELVLRSFWNFKHHQINSLPILSRLVVISLWNCAQWYLTCIQNICLEISYSMVNIHILLTLCNIPFLVQSMAKCRHWMNVPRWGCLDRFVNTWEIYWVSTPLSKLNNLRCMGSPVLSLAGASFKHF
jgi:hypothetical protein